MMRILCLTARLPYPPNRGDRLRAYNFIQSLSSQHEIHLISFIASEEEKVNIGPLQPLCKDIQVVTQSRLQSVRSVAMNLWRPLPLQALYYRSNRMQACVDAKLASQTFDLIYVHLFRMAPFVERVQGIFRVVDLTDVISREIRRSMRYRGLVSRLLYTFERPRIQHYERYVASKFEEIWLISDADKQELANDCPQANIQVINNGIDTRLFYPIEQTKRGNILMFLGHMGVPHNIDAATILAEQIYPLVKQKVPDCTLQIIGAEPAPAVQKLGSLPGVTVTGFVPDLNARLNQAAVFCAPLRFAAGIQFKVVQALAVGCPVVTTSMVNEGLRAQPGKHLIIADGVPETARAIISLLNNPSARQEMGRAGSEFIRQKFSWDIVLKRVNEIAQIITTAGGPL